MKKQFQDVIIVGLLAVAVFFAPLGSLAREAGVARGSTLASQPATQPEAADSTIFLPIVRAPPGPPDFEIISPGEGWTVSGMMYFVAQARDPQSVNSVAFSVGGTLLGIDDIPEDGFRVFFDASAFPAGALTLTAVASGYHEPVSKSVTVNVDPNPPSSGEIGVQGGVLASEIGSLITIPPAALPEGTQVSVEELTLDEISAQNGIDWEAIGVTFLGAQSIQSTAPFSIPYQVASADFGPRVQPGQAVVNYQLIPDADGDGVDEIVVVNTASVAPNNDVISDPIQQVLLDETDAGTNALFSTNSVQSTISGPPGAIITLRVVGLNPRSATGNVAEWTCADGRKITAAGSVSPNPSNPQGQMFSTVIPLCAPGPALLLIKNLSTASSVGPFIVQVTAPAPVGGTPGTGSLAYLDSTEQILDDLPPSMTPPTLTPDWEELVRVDLDAARQDIQNRMANPTPENQQDLEDSDTLLSEPGDTFPGADPGDDCLTPESKAAIEDQVNHYFLLSSYWYYKGEPELRDYYIHIGQMIGQLLELPTCGEEPQPCGPAPAASMQNPFGTTGMGAAPPPGGNGCGNVILPVGNGSRFSALAGRSTAEDSGVVVKVIATGAPIAFSGLADPGGYFFVPFIPDGQPFTAVAYDLASGETRSMQGVGPHTGESVSLFFDFFSPQTPSETVYWDGGGDGTSWHDPFNWSTDAIPNITQDVVIDVPGEITVVHSIGTHYIRSLRSEEAIIQDAGDLDIGLNPVLNNSLTIHSSTLTAAGDMLVSGSLTWTQGALSGPGTTTVMGDIYFQGPGPYNRSLLGRSLVNTGNAVFDSGSLNVAGATFTNQVGASIDFQGGLYFSITSGEIGGVSGIFENLGTLTKAPGAGPVTIYAPFNHSGTFDIPDGSVAMSGGATLTGTLQGSGTLIFAGGSSTLTGSISNLDVEVSSGAFNMDGSYSVDDTTLRFGAFNVAAGKTADTNTLTLNGGTLDGDGDMRVSGLTTWTEGAMLGTGATLAEGGLLLDSATAILHSRTLENSGTAIFHNSFLWTGVGATVTNLPGATLDIQDDFTFQNDGSATMNNQGTLIKSAGSGAASIEMAFINSGSVAVQSGELSFGGDFTQTATGTLLVEIGGLTPVSEFDQYTVAGAANLDGVLDVTLSGGFVPSAGDLFEVLRYSSHTGEFAAVNGHGQAYNANYEAAGLTLIVP